jgi:murein DD-endopeptidase MepM/ murein hydrolase activator NlpD
MWMTTLAVAVPVALFVGHWPVDEPAVIAGYSPPSLHWSNGHRGADFAATTGDRVLSMAAGTVAFVGSIAGKPVVTVALPGPEHLRSTYEPVVATVSVGDIVGPGQQIGTVAVAGGHCGGAAGCLHVGLRTDAGYLDPLSLVRPPPAVLKPRIGRR